MSCSFLTSHAGVLLCISHDPGVRLRDIAVRTGITERSAYGIVTDLTDMVFRQSANPAFERGAKRGRRRGQPAPGPGAPGGAAPAVTRKSPTCRGIPAS